MQNNPKTELLMHADPQMRIRLQLFWSIVTIFLFSTTISLRSLCNVFHIQMQSMRRFHFGWSFTTTRNASNEEKKKNQDNCSWPSWRGILQSCKTKLLLQKNEWYNGLDEQPLLQSLENTISENIFSLLNLKILGYAEKKTILSCLENSCF